MFTSLVIECFLHEKKFQTILKPLYFNKLLRINSKRFLNLWRLNHILNLMKVRKAVLKKKKKAWKSFRLILSIQHLQCILEAPEHILPLVKKKKKNLYLFLVAWVFLACTSFLWLSWAGASPLLRWAVFSWGGWALGIQSSVVAARGFTTVARGL